MFFRILNLNHDLREKFIIIKLNPISIGIKKKKLFTNYKIWSEIMKIFLLSDQSLINLPNIENL